MPPDEIGGFEATGPAQENFMVDFEGDRGFAMVPETKKQSTEQSPIQSDQKGRGIHHERNWKDCRG